MNPKMPGFVKVNQLPYPIQVGRWECYDPSPLSLDTSSDSIARKGDLENIQPRKFVSGLSGPFFKGFKLTKLFFYLKNAAINFLTKLGHVKGISPTILRG